MFTNMDVVGYIPSFLSEDDPRTAVEQIDANYTAGGGWHEFKGFKLKGGPSLCDPKEEPYSLVYPGDPPQRELSRAKLRNELLVFFESSWLAVIQPDGNFRVARLD